MLKACLRLSKEAQFRLGLLLRGDVCVANRYSSIASSLQYENTSIVNPELNCEVYAECNSNMQAMPTDVSKFSLGTFSRGLSSILEMLDICREL